MTPHRRAVDLFNAFTEEKPVKNYSPIVALSVGPYFSCWCVKAYRANGTWETVNTADTLEGAKIKMATRAAARGMIIDAERMHAELPKED